MEDRCVCCGEIIPEGRQVCPMCEKLEAKLIKCLKDAKIGCATIIGVDLAQGKDFTNISRSKED